ncbi:hypothetical protein IFO70_33795 [Phormidium tenue FACHB-886]|nr:hypothetical protein [Phormidium tenue FACHB-886]
MTSINQLNFYLFWSSIQAAKPTNSLKNGESSKLNVESDDDCNSKEIAHQSRTHVDSTKLRIQQIYFLERRLF